MNRHLEAGAVSVVIPVWDGYVVWLGEAVESVTAQGVAHEVIVVDNASEVPVPELPGTRVLRAPRRLTTGAARNLGLAEVCSEFVVFLDADDILLEGSLEAQVSGLTADAGISAVCLGLVDGSTGERHRSPRWVARVLAPHRRAFAFANSVWSLLPTQGSTVMRTAEILAAGGYADRSQGEDWVLAVSVAWRGGARFVPRPALVYRWRPDSPGRGGAQLPLVANARCVRERLRSDPAIPRRARAALPVVAMLQWAVLAGRPLVLGGRRAARSR